MAQRAGFTLIEMVLVVMIGGMLVGIAAPAYGRIASERAVGNARDAMIHTAYRARSEAMRSGKLVHLKVRPNDGVVWVVDGSGGVLHSLAMADYHAEMVGVSMDICYTARGYALPGCTTVTTGATLAFARGNATATAVVLPLGQVRRAE